MITYNFEQDEKSIDKEQSKYEDNHMRLNSIWNFIDQTLTYVGCSPRKLVQHGRRGSTSRMPVPLIPLLRDHAGFARILSLQIATRENIIQRIFQCN